MLVIFGVGKEKSALGVELVFEFEGLFLVQIRLFFVFGELGVFLFEFLEGLG